MMGWLCSTLILGGPFNPVLCLQAVYGVLKEAEHRSTFYIPYWNLPFAKNLVPRQRQFYADLAVINNCLDELIATAKATRQTDDAEALQARDYSKVWLHLSNCWARMCKRKSGKRALGLRGCK